MGELEHGQSSESCTQVLINSENTDHILSYFSSTHLGRAEEMVKEWISLVVERDRLLREQVDKVILHIWVDVQWCVATLSYYGER